MKGNQISTLVNTDEDGLNKNNMLMQKKICRQLQARDLFVTFE